MFKKPSSIVIVIVFLCQAAATASLGKTHKDVGYFDRPFATYEVKTFGF